MGSVLQNETVKNKCQIFTPNLMIETMLDLADYQDDLLGKKILENSFGTGNILKSIVTRYILSCVKEHLAPTKISERLSKDIYGIELDKELFLACKSDLDRIVASYQLPTVEWHLYNADALFFEYDVDFDYIIGNPPYITYSELDAETRKTVKNAFKSCKLGKFDYCYAFIESAISHLSPKGKLVQLIPSNIYKNVFAQNLRELLKEYLSCVFEYPTQKLFGNILTSSSIFLYDKNIPSDKVLAGTMDNLVLACHNCNHSKGSFPISADDSQFLHPDCDNFQDVFFRDELYYIKITETHLANDTVAGLYNILGLGGELCRIDYLLMYMIGFQRTQSNNSEIYTVLGLAIDKLRKKRNII